MKKVSARFFLLFVFIISTIEGFDIDRRRPQFMTEPSYLIFPLPYSLPGIGHGLLLTGLAGNISDTNIDIYALGISGDAEGMMIAVEDIHILPELLILNLSHQSISKAAVNNYEKRGMDSNIDDYTLLGVNKVISNSAELMLSLYDRRFELFAAYNKQEARIINVSDSQGNLIIDFTEPFVSKIEERSLGFLVDYTDDRENPKKGLRFGAVYRPSPAQSAADPEFYVIDKSLSFYLPVSKQATLAFNFFLSDAYVTKKGETDPDAIRAELNLNCQITDTQCLQTEQELVDMFISVRTNGTATSLGGESRLRSYPGGRYSGAHTAYYATELRWNLSEEVRPFDFGIWKDVATGLQLALFYERGSVSEKISELGDITRSTYGAGFRLVSASGFVYRADFSAGDEGEELIMTFSYPW